MTDPLLFSDWGTLARILVVGVSMYVSLLVFLRLSGSRTLSTMNAFDFIVTVAIGSAFGRALTAKSVSLAEAVVAFALLVFLQYVVTRLQVRWPPVSRVVTNPPRLLYFQGEFLRDAMRSERVTEDEIRTAARKNDHASLAAVEAVVLESSGEFSVVPAVENPEAFLESLDDSFGER
jgi:uncharacterized membrane protein YcaP (DUF421 family)